MGSVDVVLGVQWLQSLGTMTLTFQDIFIRFFSEGKEIEIRGIQGKPHKVISSNIMMKILKKGYQGVFSQLCLLDVQTSISSALVGLQKFINNHVKVYGEIPKGLAPI